MANVFINSILWFLKLKLTILCQLGTHSRDVIWIKIWMMKIFKTRGKGGLTNKSGEGELGKKNSKTNIRRTPIRHLKVLNYYEASSLTTQFPSFLIHSFAVVIQQKSVGPNLFMFTSQYLKKFWKWTRTLSIFVQKLILNSLTNRSPKKLASNIKKIETN